jgi:hypothetical protein
MGLPPVCSIPHSLAISVRRGRIGGISETPLLFLWNQAWVVCMYNIYYWFVVFDCFYDDYIERLLGIMIIYVVLSRSKLDYIYLKLKVVFYFQR